MKSCGSEGNGNSLLAPNGSLRLLSNDQDTVNLGISLLISVAANVGIVFCGVLETDDDKTTDVIVVVTNDSFTVATVDALVVSSVVVNIVVNDNISLVTFITKHKREKIEENVNKIIKNGEKSFNEERKMHNDKDIFFLFL